MDMEQQPQPSTPPQYPPPAYPQGTLSYHVPVGSAKPGSVTALAIIGIVLASLWILSGLGGVFSAVMFNVMGASFPGGMGSMKTYMILNGVINMVSGVIGIGLLVVAIACLRMSFWARRGMIYYALADLGWIVLKVILTLTLLIPAQRQWMSTLPTTPTTMTTTTTANASGGAVSTSVVTTSTGSPFGAQFDAMQVMMALGVALISAVYPTLVLIFMTRPRIREAFNATGAFY
jgi:hypothetical protein